MTLAAMSSLSISIARLAKAASESKTAALGEMLQKRALAWYCKNFGLRGSSPTGVYWGPSILYYYLYAVERVGVFLGLRRISDHEWYLEGASLIVAWQKPDGRWAESERTSVIDTAWALLFLKRATIPVATGE